ncbi:hypothetical protein P167DRAFT_572288 [Morchella conica CCBAS932]|uniref:Defective in cullin neddylation protein n=1 Tax=Morchella conica CCBAS932 TaxID=1392247 RepID=A0A3N4KYL7_9PEZI|nr:hypothetical protein P167DRAFT_572288 [Morchella conica CCBAS932]
MPPKKNTKAPAPSPTASTRSSRSQTKAGVAATDTAATGDTIKASTVGKRKRTVAEVAPVPSDSDSEEAPEVKAKAKTGPKKKAAASPTKKARTTTTTPKKRANTPFSLRTCENWFESLEDPESPGNITYRTIPAWLEELGVSAEGVVFYVIAWICKAKQTFTISREEFLYGMNTLVADSNEALVRKLPSMLKEVSPSHSNKTFDTFYKFCFNYFKPADVKNITMEVAQELFTSLLDVNRYSLSWTPSEENANECGEKEGDFPHRKAFVDFLGQSSLQVITRDQYEQFLPFNKHVPWDLVGFNEEESTWPTLMDNYIAWRKEKCP